MSVVTKSIVRQTRFLNSSYRENFLRQVAQSFSTSGRCRAEPTSTGDATKQVNPDSKSFDSVPVHLTAIGKTVMVLGGLYGRFSDVPDSIPNRVYQKTKDRFRARCVILSLFATGLLAFIAATRGRKAREDGKRYTDHVFEMHRDESRLHGKLDQSNKSRATERHLEETNVVNK